MAGSGSVSSFGTNSLFGALFRHGAADVGDRAWLQAMFAAEAALARALERAGLATRATRPGHGGRARRSISFAELGRQAAGTGNPVPALVQDLTAGCPIRLPARCIAARPARTSWTRRRCWWRGRQSMAYWPIWPPRRGSGRLAEAQAATVMIGRTSLQQAVPVTLGLVAAGWLTGLDEASSWCGGSGPTGWPCSSAGRRARWRRWGKRAPRK